MQRPVRLDELDRKILDVLERDGRATLADVGGKVGLSASAVKRRVDRLEASGALELCFWRSSSSELRASNGRSPVKASYKQVPNAYQSAAALSRAPAACSGAMYATVPRTPP